MFIDKKLEFCGDSQTVTASAASTDALDLGGPGIHGGQHVLIQVKETVQAAGAATVEVQLQTATDEAFTSHKTVASTGAIGKAALTKDKNILLPIPLDAKEQFVRLYFNVGTGPLTAGKFFAAIVDQPQAWTATKGQV